MLVTFYFAILLIIFMFGIAIRDEVNAKQLSSKQAKTEIQNHRSSTSLIRRWSKQKIAVFALLLTGSYDVAKRSCISAYTKPELSAKIVCGTGASVTAGLTLYGMSDGLLFDGRRDNT